MPHHETLAALEEMEFRRMICGPTHLNGGHIDQAWLRTTVYSDEVSCLELYSPYYNCKDHDALLFSFFDPNTEQGKNLYMYKSF